MAEVGTLGWVLLVVCCVFAYLVCGVPSAYLVGRHLGGVDVRRVGSGNVGSTNVVRAAGPKLGLLTLLCDVAKAALSVGVAYIVLGIAAGFDVVPGAPLDWMMALVYLCCVLGHMFTPYLRFKGGKGIAVGFGGAVVLAPWAGLSLWIPFLIGALATHFISAGSIAAAVCLPLLMWIFYRPSAAFLVIVCCVGALVVFAHRSNIKKLAAGTESKFTFKKTVSDPDSSQTGGEGR